MIIGDVLNKDLQRSITEGGGSLFSTRHSNTTPQAIGKDALRSLVKIYGSDQLWSTPGFCLISPIDPLFYLIAVHRS
jgi:hypothetical protein